MAAVTSHETPHREPIDTEKIRADIEKIRAEITNLIEDTRKKEDEREKIRAETRWHPLFIVAGAFAAGAVFLGAVVAAVKALLF